MRLPCVGSLECLLQYTNIQCINSEARFCAEQLARSVTWIFLNTYVPYCSAENLSLWIFRICGKTKRGTKLWLLAEYYGCWNEGCQGGRGFYEIWKCLNCTRRWVPHILMITFLLCRIDSWVAWFFNSFRVSRPTNIRVRWQFWSALN